MKHLIVLEFIEWTCEGSLNPILVVDADGNLIRYQRGVYDCIQIEWVLMHQFGWYRRSLYSFCPFRGAGAFFIIKKHELPDIFLV